MSSTCPIPTPLASITYASHSPFVPSPTHLQLDTTSYITSTAVSSNGSYLAFGDAVGTIHLLTAADESSEPFFNGFQGQPAEWADVPELPPEINWSDSTPLNSIGMPYYTNLLLSSWTPQFLSSTNPPHPPPAKIPPQILSTIKINDNVAYAPLPKELRGRRNRVVVSTTKDQHRFRSGKGRRDDDVSLFNVLPSGATHG
jgi:PAB-dependent poly(A)-specific ribonuclease subunit 2